MIPRPHSAVATAGAPKAPRPSAAANVAATADSCPGGAQCVPVALRRTRIRRTDGPGGGAAAVPRDRRWSTYSRWWSRAAAPSPRPVASGGTGAGDLRGRVVRFRRDRLRQRQRSHVGGQLPQLLVGHLAAPGRHAIRPAFDQRLMDLLQAAAVDPHVVHEIRTHAAAAVRMAPRAVVLREEPLARIDRLRVVVIRGGARIGGHEAMIDAGVERRVDDAELTRLAWTAARRASRCCSRPRARERARAAT